MIEADRTMLQQRESWLSYLPNAAQCKEAMSMIEGALLQNERILYWLHLVITSEGDAHGKV